MKRGFWFVVFLAVGFFSLEAAEPLLNHGGSVTGLAFDQEAQRLYSIGEDGFLKIWDTHSLDMEHSLSISSEPLEKILINRKARRILIVESIDEQKKALRLHNMDTLELLNRVVIDKPIHSMAFSPSGTMFIVAQQQKDSLLFFETEGLNRILLPFKVTETVLDFYINDQETAFLALTQSATIFYFNLQENKVIKTLRAEVKPQNCIILPGGNYFLNKNGVNLQLVSLSNGKVLNTTQLPDEQLIPIVPTSLGAVTYFSQSSREAVFYTWNYRKKGDIFVPSHMIRNPDPITQVLEFQNNFFVGYERGSVSILSEESKNMALSSAFEPEKINDFVVVNNHLYVSTQRHIHAYSLQEEKPLPLPLFNSHVGDSRLYPLDKDILLITDGGNGSRWSRLDSLNGQTKEKVSLDFTTLDVLNNENLLVRLDGQRQIQILKKENLELLEILPGPFTALLAITPENLFALSPQNDSALQQLITIDLQNFTIQSSGQKIDPLLKIFRSSSKGAPVLLTQHLENQLQTYRFIHPLDPLQPPQLLWESNQPLNKLNGFFLNDQFYLLLENRKIYPLWTQEENPVVLTTLKRPSEKIIEGEKEFFVLNKDQTVSIYSKESFDEKALLFVSQGRLHEFKQVSE